MAQGILPRIDKALIMVDVTVTLPNGAVVKGRGIPSPEFQRRWQSAVAKADEAAADADGKVNTKTINYTAPTISNPPTQAQVQAIANALETVTKALRNE
jgi:hypothetical protein